MDQRDPRGGRMARSDGRPPFGLGPIGRVGSVLPDRLGPAAATAQGPTMTSAHAFGAPSGGRTPTPLGIAGRSSPAGRADIARARAFGLPNLRRNVCPHFFITGSRGAIPIHAPHLLKALVRQDSNVSRCQLRGGVHLEQGYVNDVCLSSRFNQCVFYEEDLAG